MVELNADMDLPGLPRMNVDIPMPPLVKPPRIPASAPTPTPYRCPCCDGWGKRDRPDAYTSTAIEKIPCLPCSGTGLV